MTGDGTPLTHMLSWYMDTLSAYSLFKLIVHSLCVCVCVCACACDLLSGLNAVNFPQSSLV